MTPFFAISSTIVSNSSKIAFGVSSSQHSRTEINIEIDNFITSISKTVKFQITIKKKMTQVDSNLMTPQITPRVPAHGRGEGWSIVTDINLTR